MLFLQYLSIALFTVLLAITLRNCWVIFFKLRRYHNTTLLTFYVLVLLALTLRIETLIMFWLEVYDWSLFTTTM